MNTPQSIELAGVVLIVMGLLMALQQYRVIILQGQATIETQAKQDILTTDAESQATLTSLQAEAKRNADYQADLAKRLKASQQKALKAEKDFEKLKRTSKPVRDWAAQPLPDGLRGQPAATGGKDNSGKARTP